MDHFRCYSQQAEYSAFLEGSKQEFGGEQT